MQEKHDLKVPISVRFKESDVNILKKICEDRGEYVSSFIRRSTRKELARMSFLNAGERKALEVSTSEGGNGGDVK